MMRFFYFARSGANVDHQEIRRRALAVCCWTHQCFNTCWAISIKPKALHSYSSSKKVNTRPAWPFKLQTGFEPILHFEDHRKKCISADDWISAQEQSTTGETICIQQMPFNWDGASRYSIGCQLCRRFWSSYFTRPSRSEFSVWRHRSSDTAGKITLWFWFFWSSTELGAIVFNRQVTTSLFQWNFVISDASDVWLSTGSVLGPLLFILYTAEIPSIVESFGFHAHSYVDDLQIYAHSDPKEAYTLVASFSDCRCHQGVDGKQPFTAQSGADRSYLAWFYTSPPPLPDDAYGHLWCNDQTIHQSSQSWCHVGQQLIDAITCQYTDQYVFFHIRQLRLVRRSLAVDTAHTLVRSMIHSRLDYCNGVLAGSSVEMVRWLQSILKSAVSLWRYWLWPVLPVPVLPVLFWPIWVPISQIPILFAVTLFAVRNHQFQLWWSDMGHVFLCVSPHPLFIVFKYIFNYALVLFVKYKSKFKLKNLKLLLLLFNCKKIISRVIQMWLTFVIFENHAYEYLK